MTKKIYWANFRDEANQAAYIELNQISRGKWRVTLEQHEYVIKCPSTDLLEVLEVAISHRPQSQ